MSDGQYGGHVGFSLHYFRSQLIIKNLMEVENKSNLFMILMWLRAMVTKMTKSCVLSVLSGKKVQSTNSFTIQFSKINILNSGQ